MDNIHFTSERLIFRSLQPSDVNQTYLEWLMDRDVNQFLETRFNVPDLQACIAYVLKSNSDNNECLVGIFNHNGRHIGNIKLAAINNIHGTAEIGLMIGDKESWGGGYGTEAIIAMCQWGFESLGLKKITAGCYEGNVGSHRCFLKAGFKVEGFAREQFLCNGKRVGSYRFGALADEFK